MKLRKITKTKKDYYAFDMLYYHTDYSYSVGKVSEYRTEIDPNDPPLTYEQYCKMVEDEYKKYFILENDKGKVIATVILLDDGNILNIEEMIVSRENQMKGIGKTCFHLIESKAKTEKKKKITLTCYFPGATIFWKKMGFEEYGFLFTKKLK